MSKLIGQVDLPRRSNGKLEAASVFLGLHERHLADHEKVWRPALSSALKQAESACRDAKGKLDEKKFVREIERLAIGDATWDWRKIHVQCSDNSQHEFIAVECVGHTQGLMLLDTEDYATRLSQKGRGLVYIEGVAVAPSNRERLGASGFRYVGRLLVATAISSSLERGLDGRIGLHSLRGVEGFYRDSCGMTALGPDSKKGGLAYFEMDEQQAASFLAKKGGKGGSP